MRLRKSYALVIAAVCWALHSQCASADDIGPLPPQAAAQLVESKFIFPQQHKENVHSSSIIQLPDGGLLAAWFQGSGECDVDDVRIMGARKPAGTAKWSEPFLLADTPGHPDCNPVLWIDKSNRLWLIWSAILSNDWKSSLIKYRVSTEYMNASGAPKWDWQDVLHLKPIDLDRHMLSGWNHLLESVLFVPRALAAELSTASTSQLLVDVTKLALAVALLISISLAVNAWRRRRTGHSGWKRFVLRASATYATLLAATAAGAIGFFSWQSSDKLNQRLGWMTAEKPIQLSTGEIVIPLYSDRFIASIMAISTDGGATWEASDPLVGYGNIQPSLVERRNGDLVAWMREAGLRKRVRFSVSSDRGHTWSPVRESELPNPGAKVAVTALENGDWVLAHNPLVDGRHELALAISKDEGATWQPFHALDQVLPEAGSCSYPSLIQTADGCIQVTYSYRQQDGKSIKHVTLRPPGQAPQIELAKVPDTIRR